VEDRPYNDIRYRITTSKLEDLGWKPKINFKEGLLKTIEWYRQNPNHFAVPNATSGLAEFHPMLFSGISKS
jgi:dTDP-D-glucose 4,6-dehydratase